MWAAIGSIIGGIFGGGGKKKTAAALKDLQSKVNIDLAAENEKQSKLILYLGIGLVGHHPDRRIHRRSEKTEEIAMAILNICGQPVDKNAYVQYSDMPSDMNKAYQMPFNESAGVGSKLGAAFDPSEMFVDGDPVQGAVPGQNAIPEWNSITKVPDAAPDSPKWHFILIGLAAAWIIFMFTRGSKRTQAAITSRRENSFSIPDNGKDPERMLYQPTRIMSSVLQAVKRANLWKRTSGGL